MTTTYSLYRSYFLNCHILSITPVLPRTALRRESQPLCDSRRVSSHRSLTPRFRLGQSGVIAIPLALRCDGAVRCDIATAKRWAGGTVYCRYIVEDFKGVLLLTLIFNGNLCIKHRVAQLDKWLTDINLRLSTPTSKIYGLCSTITLITTLFKPSLTNAWLSGFTDAEGCFNVSITKRANTVSGYRVILRYMLDQKNSLYLLTIIRDLFGYGAVIVRSKDIFRYYCNTFTGLSAIDSYFSSFPLKSKKAVSHANWLKVYKMVINKEHLTTQGLEKIRAIKKTININNSLTTKTGSAKP